MIDSNPKYFYEYKMLAWTGSAVKDTGVVPEWINDSTEPFLDPERAKDRIAAACEDVSILNTRIHSVAD